MGIDDNNKMVHENINDGSVPESATLTGTLITDPAMYNIQFSGGRDMPQVLLTLTTDGKLVIGPGLSEDEATQRVAHMLAEQYGRQMERIRQEEEAKRA